MDAADVSRFTAVFVTYGGAIGLLFSLFSLIASLFLLIEEANRGRAGGGA